jgi:hypothetical protein
LEIPGILPTAGVSHAPRGSIFDELTDADTERLAKSGIADSPEPVDSGSRQSSAAARYLGNTGSATRAAGIDWMKWSVLFGCGWTLLTFLITFAGVYAVLSGAVRPQPGSARAQGAEFGRGIAMMVWIAWIPTIIVMSLRMRTKK